MPYYNSEIYNTNPELLNYFTSAIKDENKSISHCLLFWGGDIKTQCEIALEIARLLNCKKDGAVDCDCQNCRWIREQTHPAVKKVYYPGLPEAQAAPEMMKKNQQGRKILMLLRQGL